MKLARTLQGAAAAVTKQGTSGVRSVELAANHAGSATISVAIKAGSRYAAAPGVTHCLQAGRSMTSVSHTSFLQTQQLEAAGAEVICENTRDHLVYTLKAGPRLVGELFSDVVAPAIFQSETWQWEVTELEPHMKFQNASGSLDLDMLHSVSFSEGGLNNLEHCPAARLGAGDRFNHDAVDHASTYVPVPQINVTRVQSEELLAHKSNHFTSDNVTVFSSGLNKGEHKAMTSIVAQLCSQGPSTQAPGSKFVAGEHRNNTGFGAPSGYVGFPGAAGGTAEAGAAAVLAQAMGGQSFNYEGAGLIAVPTSDPKGTVSSMSKLGNADIENAKLQVGVAHAHTGTCPVGAVMQNLNSTAGLNIDGVTVASVKALATKLAKGQKSLAMSGDLSGVPHASEL